MAVENFGDDIASIIEYLAAHRNEELVIFIDENVSGDVYIGKSEEEIEKYIREINEDAEDAENDLECGSFIDW